MRTELVEVRTSTLTVVDNDEARRIKFTFDRIEGSVEMRIASIGYPSTSVVFKCDKKSAIGILESALTLIKKESPC